MCSLLVALFSSDSHTEGGQILLLYFCILEEKMQLKPLSTYQKVENEPKFKTLHYLTVSCTA